MWLNSDRALDEAVGDGRDADGANICTDVHEQAGLDPSVVAQQINRGFELMETCGPGEQEPSASDLILCIEDETVPICLDIKTVRQINSGKCIEQAIPARRIRVFEKARNLRLG